MTQYIDKSVLISEIEKRLDRLLGFLPNTSDVVNDSYTREEADILGKYSALESFRDYINTHEEKENGINYKGLYEETISRLKIAKENVGFYTFSDVIGKVIPELAESEDEIIRKEIIDFFKKKNFPCSKRFIAWLEKQGELNPTDKVEPKFKVGDWVVYERSGNTYQIHSIDDSDSNYIIYVCKPLLDNNDDIPCFCEEMIHLWTIQDAKDGDVLVTHLSPEGDWVGIYKQSTDPNRFNTYCFLNSIGEFVINSNRCKNHGTHGLHPATKEQRDLLFSKMKEAGYKWDAENKELRKIEQKPTWSKEDEQNLNASLGYIGDEYLRRWLKDIVHVKYDKLAWSEEDEKMLNIIIKNLDEREWFDIYQANWLKSLKDRITLTKNDNDLKKL